MDVPIKVEAIIQGTTATVAVAFHDLQTGERWSVAGDEIFHSASTMKLCVLAELFHQAETNRLELDEQIEIGNAFHSLADGSPFALDPEDDSDKGLYGRIGQHETLLNLAVPMIVESSNLATNLLVEKLGAPNINETMKRWGVSSLHVRRGVMDMNAYSLGLNNTVTADDLTALMAKVATQQVLTQDASKAFIGILLRQQHRNCLPAGLPPDVRVANKTGWNENLCHDSAIIYGPRGPYVLTVLTQGLEEMVVAPKLIAEISAAVYESVS